MIIQNLHPIYKALLTHNYTIKVFEIRKDGELYELNCKNHKVIVGFEHGSFYIYDDSCLNNLQYAVLPSMDSIFDKNKNKDVYYFMNKLVLALQKSTDIKNLQIMDFIICEIIKAVPDVTYIHFSPISIYENISLKFVDQKRRLFEIQGTKIIELIHNVYFIDGLRLGYNKNLNQISNHNMMEIHKKSSQLKELLKLDLKIQEIIF